MLEQAEHLNKSRIQLIGLMQSKEVAAEMYQQNALTSKELQKIQASKSESQAVDRLLDIVVAAPRVVYESFLESLRHTKHESAFQLIACEGSDFIVSAYMYLLVSNF